VVLEPTNRFEDGAREEHDSSYEWWALLPSIAIVQESQKRRVECIVGGASTSSMNMTGDRVFPRKSSSCPVVGALVVEVAKSAV